MPKHQLEREVMRKPELDAMMERAKPTTRALIAILWLFGKRISEVLRLKRRDIWAEGDLIYASFHVLKKKTREDTGVSKPFVKSMRITHPYYKYLYYYLKEKRFGADDLIFPFSRHKAYRLIKEVNPKTYPHFFRTSLATRMAELGATEYELMHWFDWDRSSTAGGYVKHTSKLAERWSKREF